MNIMKFINGEQVPMKSILATRSSDLENNLSYNSCLVQEPKNI